VGWGRAREILQTASLNLRTASFEPACKESVVIDPNTVEATPMGETPWNSENFEAMAEAN